MPLSFQNHGSTAREERGAVAVEFAIILPLLLVLLFLVVDFGRAFNEWNDLNQVAGEGARFASVNRNPGEDDGMSLQAWLQSQMDTAELREGSDDADAATVCVEYPADARPGDSVTVRITADFPLLNFLTAELDAPPSIPISGSATMRLESVPTNFASDC